MSRILRQALEQVAAAIAAASPSLKSIRVESAPPTEESEYQAIALVPDRFIVDPEPDDEVLGDDDRQVAPSGRPLAAVGALRGSCRMFLAARLPAQREALQDEVTAAFFQDDTAPSRLMATIENVEVGGIATGVDWNVAGFIVDEEWRDELVFSERRWAFRKLEIDVPILVLRNTPVVTRQALLMAVASDLVTVAEPADLSEVPIADSLSVAADGSLTPFP